MIECLWYGRSPKGKDGRGISNSLSNRKVQRDSKSPGLEAMHSEAEHLILGKNRNIYININ